VVPPTRRRTSQRNKGAGKFRWIILSVVLPGAAGAMVCGVVWLILNSKAKDPDKPGAQKTEIGHGTFVIPPGLWHEHRGAVNGLQVNFALLRKEPASSLALLHRDYKHRLPTEAEMQDVALSRLRRYFKPMEWERKTKPKGMLGGLPPAMVLVFEGTDPDNVTMSGEVWAVADRGIGYWFFTWCPMVQQGKGSAEWEEIRSGFSLPNTGEPWTETPRDSETVSVGDLPFEIRFVKGLWQNIDGTEKWDANAKIVLLGNDPTESKYAGKAANFQIIVLEKAQSLKEAADKARQYLLKGQKEEYPETVIEPIQEKGAKDTNTETKIGSEPGELFKLHVRNSETRERYVILGVVQAAENTLMLMGECDFARKDFWDVEFLPLLNGFQAKK
jgi:hypothetical protein